MKYLFIFGITLLIGLSVIVIINTDTAFYLLAMLPFIIYFILICFVVWFAVSFIQIQKEKNTILKEIADKMEHQNK